MNFNENDEIIWEFGVDFDIGDKVYAPDGTAHVVGILCGVLRNIAYVKFIGHNSPTEVPLTEVSPYDTI
jgi:hypothetical protein